MRFEQFLWCFIANQFIDIGPLVCFLFTNYTNLHDCDLEVYLQKNYETGQLYIVGIRLTFMYGKTGIKTIDIGNTDKELHDIPHFVVILGFNAFVNVFGLEAFATYRRMFVVTNNIKELILDITNHGVEYQCTRGYIPYTAFEQPTLFFTPLSVYGI